MENELLAFEVRFLKAQLAEPERSTAQLGERLAEAEQANARLRARVADLQTQTAGLQAQLVELRAIIRTVSPFRRLLRRVRS